MSVTLERIAFEVGDRFAHQARAQLQAKEKPGKGLPSLDPAPRARAYPTGTRSNRSSTCTHSRYGRTEESKLTASWLTARSLASLPSPESAVDAINARLATKYTGDHSPAIVIAHCEPAPCALRVP